MTQTVVRVKLFVQDDPTALPLELPVAVDASFLAGLQEGPDLLCGRFRAYGMDTVFVNNIVTTAMQDYATVHLDSGTLPA